MKEFVLESYVDPCLKTVPVQSHTVCCIAHIYKLNITQ